jgi:E3 ubiquitin-protein ligase HUWE1
VTSALNISTPRLRSLAKRWPNLREYGVGLVDLASTRRKSEVDALPSEAQEVNFSFYRTDNKEKQRKDDTEMQGTHLPETSQTTPRKPASASMAAINAAITIHIDQQTLESTDLMTLLADTIQTYSVPDEEKFELLCRIRSAIVLTKGKEAEREKLIIIRLLSIAIFGHTHIEAQAMSSLFLYEPDLIAHIAELLQLDRGISVTVQTAAIAALDALARYRNKVQEVLTAINAGVNHGILMALVRKTVADVGSLDCRLPHSFVEALLSFVTYIASHSAGGNMVVGAGLVPLLVQIIGNKIPERLAVVSKTMQLVDNVLYSFANAFQLFCGGRGVEALVDRIEVSIRCSIMVSNANVHCSMKSIWISRNMVRSTRLVGCLVCTVSGVAESLIFVIRPTRW